MAISKFAFPTAIHFGPGARRLVAENLKAAGCRRPLLVTDRGLAALPVLEEFRSYLSEFELNVFSGVQGNPVASQVRAGAEAYRAHRADSVIGFGGGAALDVAKVVALMATHPGDVLEYAWDHPAVRPIDKPLPHFVALPTTAGTGSEVGRSSVISEDDTHVKRIVFSAALLAKAVFADPELTLGLPANITAATGMDALTHNIESYLSPAYHPLCDGIALEGARIVSRALPLVHKNGKNLEARADMLMGSMMGAIAFQKDLGAVHSCAHALSTVADLHHGLANGIMIDHVMRFNRPAAEERMKELARVAGASDLISFLAELKKEIAIPDRLGVVGIRKDQIPKLVDIALADICHQTNPRPCSRQDFERLFAAAL
jgi:alcohol dehydrogenase class IV